MEFIRQAKRKAEQVELYQVTVTETPVRYENNKLKSIDTSEKTQRLEDCLRTAKLGFATSTGADLEPAPGHGPGHSPVRTPWTRSVGTGRITPG